MTALQDGSPSLAEPELARLTRRSTAVVRQGGAIAPTRYAVDAAPDPRAGDGSERRWGPTDDFVGVAFLERGAAASNSVGRIVFRDGQPQGTGFLIGAGLFLTNNHVIETPSHSDNFLVEFDYQIDSTGRQKEVSRFSLAASEFFVTDDRDDLDYTVIAIGSQIDGPKNLGDFGYCSLSGADDKHSLGEVANIVQHPDGRLKEVVLRENRLVSRLSHVLHYVADTEPGSSGSPVFNNQWQAIALHHWGGPWRQDVDIDGMPVPRYVNEGIRISAIVEELRDKEHGLSSSVASRLRRALSLGESTRGLPVESQDPVRDDGRPTVETRPDGTAVWRVPIEIAVGIPGSSSAPIVDADDRSSAPRVSTPVAAESFRRVVDRDYQNRKGYRSRFLSGATIGLPKMSSTVRQTAAENLEAEPGDDKFEFAYEHFSVYVNGERGLPIMTACNIDGKNLKDINRRTGVVSDAESVAADFQPEAREKWYEDPRIDPAMCGNDQLYRGQQVSAGPNRLGRIFHRGHMVRRLDPCWGSRSSALRAEADTFHFTNCTPQIGSFNTRQSLWQGIENHVLDSAKDDDLRVTVFTGPVFQDDDPGYREDVFPGFKIPMQFWKIAIWKDSGSLSAIAMLADQSVVLDELPEGGEGLDEVSEIEEFIDTVPGIERLTGLDFGSEVRDADLFELVDAERIGRSKRKAAPALPELKISARGKSASAKRKGRSRKKPAKKTKS